MVNYHEASLEEERERATDRRAARNTRFTRSARSRFTHEYSQQAETRVTYAAQRR